MCNKQRAGTDEAAGWYDALTCHVLPAPLMHASDAYLCHDSPESESSAQTAPVWPRESMLHMQHESVVMVGESWYLLQGAFTNSLGPVYRWA